MNIILILVYNLKYQKNVKIVSIKTIKIKKYEKNIVEFDIFEKYY